MKKQAAIIVLFLASLVVSVQAKEQNGWYVGTKLGWSNLNVFNYKSDSKSLNKSENSKNNFYSPTFSVFLGYDINPYFSFEAENDTSGFFSYLMLRHETLLKDQESLKDNNFQIATKLSYPITNNFHLYSRLGGTILWDDLLEEKGLKNLISKKSKLLPTFTLGAEYIFKEQFFARIDYTWKSTIQNIASLSMHPSLGDTVLSFGWKFGQSHNNHAVIPSLCNSEFTNSKNIELRENINFPFNSAEIKPIAYDKLEVLNDEISDKKLTNVSIILSGYSDKIGNRDYNQKLSEDRAYAVKNYLISRGFSRDIIKIQGMGDINSLTNQVCKDIKNRSLLISCLAPDRRVEIEVVS
ncbi:hypothetical protein D9V75_01595 [Buchnera aphidicola (Muscaphis stroyani)]|uniref:Outer membrane protein A n=1 Tax=Buchnera aphidicola (Muscaphis stroyani) TaxID=1241869 RepID=A0A4D6Y5I8_9GAMM|nr:OmpA family protein [Buchnera aphidicola]QCI24399.1 hypothetical protein D9V75_01595 [Buchnera aphidicola (Muscaphis stroyani)]